MTSDPISPAGQRLLRIAKHVSGATDAEGPALSAFVQTYREWIATNRGRFGTQQQQAEQWQLIMHAMVTAPRVEEAIGRLIRFGKVVWGERGPADLRHEGDCSALVFAEPFRAGPEGLIAAIWPLALTLCELEFLAGTHFDGVSGRVSHSACLPDGIIRLLFAPPIAFESGEVALLVPRHYLHRPVTARATDLPGFFGQLLPLTLGARRARPSIGSMTAGLIRDDKRGPDYREPTLANVASRLGMSTATLRRRLRGESTSYRLIKEGVFDTLARDWLMQRDLPIADIAARLDFSDAFAFRRFFRRLNGMPPSAYAAGARPSRASDHYVGPEDESEPSHAERG